MERDEPLNRSKYLGLIVLIFALVLSTFAIAYWLGLNQGLSFSAESRTGPSGKVTVIGSRDGILFYNYTTHNAIMTIGSTYVRNFFLNDSAIYGPSLINKTDDIALSAETDPTPLTTWTKLPSEITATNLNRTSGTATVINSTAYKVEYTWTASASEKVNCTGLHWSDVDGSTGNMLAAAEISEVSLIAGDELKVTWTVNIPDG